MAAARYWIATTTANWNSTANWSTSSGGSGGASVPSSTDDVYFNSARNGNCTIDATVSINGMDIGGYSGAITNTNYAFTVSANNYLTQSSGTFNGGSSNITINARLSISGGTFNCGSGTVDINGTGFYLSGGTFTATSGSMYVSNYWNHSAGTFTHNNGTVVFDGTNQAPIYMVGNVESFYNVIINRTSGGYLYMYATNDKMLINGNLNLTNGAVYSWNGGSNKILEVLGNVTVASTFTITGVEITLKFSGTATQYFDLTGATSVYDGKIEINKSSGSVILSSNLTMNASGQDLNLASGTLNLNGYTLTNSTATTNCSGTFAVSGTGTLSNYAWAQTSGAAAFSVTGASNFSINNNFSISQGTFSAGTATTFDVNGNFTLTGGTFTAPSGTMYLSGNWNHNTGGAFNPNNGTVCFDGAVNSIIYMISNLETFYSLTVNKNSSYYLTMYLTNDRILVNGNLNLTNGAVYSWNGGQNKILEVLGNVTVANTFTGTGTEITLKFSGSATQYFDLTGATAVYDGKIEINKSSASVILSSNLTMNASGQDLNLASGTLNLNGYTLTNSTATTNCSGTFAVSGTGTFSNYVWSQVSGAAAFSVTGASDFSINNNFSISQGTFSAGTATTFDVNGNFTLTGGTFTAPSGTMYLSGNWDHNTGGTFNHNNGTVCFDGSGNSVIYMISNLETFYSLTINKTTSYYLMMYVTNDRIIVNGNLNLTNGALYSWNGGQAKILEVLGDVNVSNTFVLTGEEVALNFTGSTSVQTFTFTGTTSRIQGNITVNKTSGKVNLGSGVTIYTAKSLTVTAGTLNCLNQVVSGPTFTLASGATLELGSTGGIASSGATGNIQTTTRTFNSGSFYVYSGISGAQVTGTGLPSTIAGLTINNSSGVSLTASETINTLFTLTNGNLSLGIHNIVMASGSSISGGSTSSFVYTGSTGFLKYNSCAASSTKTFPVGHTNTSAGYTPLVIVFNLGHTTDDFNVIAVDKVTDDGTRTGATYTSTVVKAMWFITETTSGGSNVNLQFQWNTTDEGSGFDRTSCRMAHYNSSTWTNIGNLASASGSNPFTFISSNYTGTFSPFGMNGGGGPLPVKFLNIDVKKTGNDIIIKWATAIEINNDYFIIEKSYDNQNFFEIGRVKGFGNSQQIQSYSFIDNALNNNINYYRLKQVDYDGKFEYSNVAVLNILNQNTFHNFRAFPNPATNQVTLEILSSKLRDSKYTISDIQGKIYNTSLFSNIVSLDLTTYPNGVYLISFFNTNDEIISHQKLIIKK
ncbi:MAG: T9SS type A sorting domain-containing protein [Bacteroidia bacterium]